MKHILEYEDLEALYGDLKSLGVTRKELKGTLWARFNTYRLLSGYWTYTPVIVCFLETEPFYGTGDEEKDKSMMLQKIQKGEFVRPSHPSARPWDVLRGGNDVAIDLLEKSIIQSRAKTCSTIDDLIEELRESLVAAQKFALEGQLYKTRYLNEEAASTVLVYGFLGPEDSPYLVTGDLDLPFEKGEGINYYTK